MNKKKKICPYEQVAGKIDTIDMKLEKTRCEIESLAKSLEEEPEICPDVEDSERALQETLDKFMKEELFKHTNKIIGEA
jgi:DNA-binding FrmR family transcriptional regulator|tara:strand:+ start:367 stop:603 length:237 start_codon:yes stop_codon:yes gene_type:complete